MLHSPLTRFNLEGGRLLFARSFAVPLPASLPRLVSFVTLLVVIAGLGIVFFRVMAPFLLPLFLAALLVVIFRPAHHWILVKCQGRQRLAAGLTTAVVMLVVLVPIGCLTAVAVHQAAELMSMDNLREIGQQLTKWRAEFGLTMPHAEQLRRIENVLERLSEREEAGVISSEGRPVAQAALHDLKTLENDPRLSPLREEMETLRSALEQLDGPEPVVLNSQALRRAKTAYKSIRRELLGGPVLAAFKELANPSEQLLDEFRSQLMTFGQRQAAPVAKDVAAFMGKLIIGLIIIGVALYYFLADGPVLLADLMRLSPLDDQYEAELLAEFDQISRAVVLATLLSAIAQGILAGIGFAVAGVQSVVLLALLTMVLAMIPFLGAAAVWIPVSLWLIFGLERPVAGLALAAYGALVISLVDNVIKPFVLHGHSKLHPLLALLSVLGGVTALGPIGIFVGPMVVAFLQTLLNILHRELLQIGERVETGKPIAKPQTPPPASHDEPKRGPKQSTAIAETNEAKDASSLPHAGGSRAPARKRRRRRRRRRGGKGDEG